MDNNGELSSILTSDPTSYRFSSSIAIKQAIPERIRCIEAEDVQTKTEDEVEGLQMKSKLEDLYEGPTSCEMKDLQVEKRQ